MESYPCDGFLFCFSSSHFSLPSFALRAAPQVQRIDAGDVYARGTASGNINTNNNAEGLVGVFRRHAASGTGQICRDPTYIVPES
jgi:hypothetical protein